MLITAQILIVVLSCLYAAFVLISLIGPVGPMRRMTFESFVVNAGLAVLASFALTVVWILITCLVSPIGVGDRAVSLMCWLSVIPIFIGWLAGARAGAENIRHGSSPEAPPCESAKKYAIILNISFLLVVGWWILRAIWFFVAGR